ncbi:hypothetical protein HAP48_0035175 [Bradyrhizobium septentrionale]|uniref:Uncharacterized protein n=1 Tax=Bradyrhizobium septentrionale TaxID=1404411 RepID=A0A974A271_9BRAD|nr:hypothetical protein [Bradyrhizobium septentrionale]UGY13777.1 hypothetical protein HAP48_0035175 [Bradyrhizobium septentrionale]
MTIVKVQVPLSTTIPSMSEVALIYGEGRKRMTQQTLGQATRAMMGSDVNAFFEGNYRAGRWEIGKRVEDQDW